MKDFIHNLFVLLNNCSEDRNEAQKLQYLSGIVRLNAYKELQDNPAFKDEFEQKYTLSALEKLELPDLKERRDEIVVFANVLKKLSGSILYGNAPELKKDDAPNFDDRKSIVRLSKKVRVSDARTNYANISLANLMKIFDDTTIKSAQECLNLFPLSLAKRDVITEEDIKNTMGNKLYCINANDFQKAHSAFLMNSMDGERKVKQEKERRKKYWLFKIAILMLIWGGLFACSQFGVVSASSMPYVSGILLVISCVFTIWG